MRSRLVDILEYISGRTEQDDEIITYRVATKTELAALKRQGLVAAEKLPKRINYYLTQEGRARLRLELRLEASEALLQDELARGDSQPSLGAPASRTTKSARSGIRGSKPS